MMTDANSLDGRKLSLSAQKALRQRVIEADKKGIKRTQIAKTFGMSRQWVWKVLRAFEKHGEEAAIAGHSRGPKPETSDKMRRLSRQEEAKLMAWIIDSNPSQLKFPCGLDAQGRARPHSPRVRQGNRHSYDQRLHEALEYDARHCNKILSLLANGLRRHILRLSSEQRLKTL